MGNGLEADAVAPPKQEPKVNYGWGAENQTGGMVRTTPSNQQVASPSSAPQPAAGTHS